MCRPSRSRSKLLYVKPLKMHLRKQVMRRYVHTGVRPRRTWPVVSYCLCAKARSSSAQPMRPGYSSQNSFKSTPKMRGCSSRPIQKSYAGQPDIPDAAVMTPFRKDAAYSVMESEMERMIAPESSSTK